MPDHATHKAVVFTEYGDPSVLRIAELPTPAPGPGEVLLDVRAAALQPWDNLFRSGGARSFAPASFEKDGTPQGVGNEAAGVVAAVGEGVAFAVGDEVLGWVSGAAAAERVLVPASQLVAKPATMPWTEAGALTASGQTAHTALTALGVGAGETVLVHAAAGGVGAYAVQIAAAWGARVIGTASERNHEFLRGLGAEPVAYGEGLADRVRAIAPGGVDASLDCVATEDSLRAGAELVSTEGRAGTIAYNALAGELGIRQLGTERDRKRLGELVALYEAGKLRVEVQAVYPLDAVAEAARAVAGGHVRGKVVVTP